MIQVRKLQSVAHNGLPLSAASNPHTQPRKRTCSPLDAGSRQPEHELHPHKLPAQCAELLVDCGCSVLDIRRIAKWRAAGPLRMTLAGNVNAGKTSLLKAILLIMLERELSLASDSTQLEQQAPTIRRLVADIPVSRDATTPSPTYVRFGPEPLVIIHNVDGCQAAESLKKLSLPQGHSSQLIEIFLPIKMLRWLELCDTAGLNDLTHPDASGQWLSVARWSQVVLWLNRGSTLDEYASQDLALAAQHGCEVVFIATHIDQHEDKDAVENRQGAIRDASSRNCPFLGPAPRVIPVSGLLALASCDSGDVETTCVTEKDIKLLRKADCDKSRKPRAWVEDHQRFPGQDSLASDLKGRHWSLSQVKVLLPFIEQHDEPRIADVRNRLRSDSNIKEVMDLLQEWAGSLDGPTTQAEITASRLSREQSAWLAAVTTAARRVQEIQHEEPDFDQCWVAWEKLQEAAAFQQDKSPAMKRISGYLNQHLSQVRPEIAERLTYRAYDLFLSADIRWARILLEKAVKVNENCLSAKALLSYLLIDGFHEGSSENEQRKQAEKYLCAVSSWSSDPRVRIWGTAAQAMLSLQPGNVSDISLLKQQGELDAIGYYTQAIISGVNGRGYREYCKKALEKAPHYIAACCLLAQSYKSDKECAAAAQPIAKFAIAQLLRRFHGEPIDADCAEAELILRLARIANCKSLEFTDPPRMPSSSANAWWLVELHKL